MKFIGFIRQSDVSFSELNLFVGQLTPKQKADPAVRHALGVQRALAMGNYHSLFDLYLTSPNMGAYIMDHFIDRERVKALMIITKAYVSCCNGACLSSDCFLVRYKTISLVCIQNELAFDSADLARTFLVEHSAAFFINAHSPDEQKTLDCKSAMPHLAQVLEEKYRKVMIKGAI